MPSYITVARPLRIEIDRVKASRFIADIAPIDDADAAEAFIASVRDAFPDATHHCYAWRLRGDVTRQSDDGEPGGSAGRPILNHLVGAELEMVAIVVTRYYGGTKLGVGGLIRAYGGAAQAAIDAAERAACEAMVRVAFEYDYALSGVIDSVLTAFDAEIVETTFEVTVSRAVRVREVDERALRDELQERSAGRIRWITPA